MFVILQNCQWCWFSYQGRHRFTLQYRFPPCRIWSPSMLLLTDVPSLRWLNIAGTFTVTPVDHQQSWSGGWNSQRKGCLQRCWWEATGRVTIFHISVVFLFSPGCLTIGEDDKIAEIKGQRDRGGPVKAGRGGQCAGTPLGLGRAGGPLSTLHCMSERYMCRMDFNQKVGRVTFAVVNYCALTGGKLRKDDNQTETCKTISLKN